MHLVSMTMFGSRFSQIILQKSEMVLGMGPGQTDDDVDPN